MSTAVNAAKAREARKSVMPGRKSRQQQKRERQLAKGLGKIEKGEVYPLALFQQLTGMGDWAVRQAERNGLDIAVVGNERHVTGDEWHRYVTEQAKSKRKPADDQSQAGE